MMSNTRDATTTQHGHTPRTIVVATCGNGRKYQQSFFALIEAAKNHNARIESASTHMHTPLTVSASDETDVPLSPHVLFQFVCLHYDEQSGTMYLSNSPYVTKRTESPSESEDSVQARSAAAAAGGGGVLDELAVHVHVIIHKVASFGTARAAKALTDWARAQRDTYHSNLPIIVDPVAEVDVLNSRSALYALLDSVPNTCIARTYLWSPPTDASNQDELFPIGAQSALPLTELGATRPLRLANGTPSCQWWIIKPDEGSGPAFTHHLVMWRTDKTPTYLCAKSGEEEEEEKSEKEEEACAGPHRPCVPDAVQGVLPTAAQPRFIVQELYTAALPIVLKVYCIHTHVFVKVSPTVKMLAMLRDGSTNMDVPVFMDSQNKELFTSTGLPTATSSASSRHNSRTLSLNPSGDFSTATPTTTGVVVGAESSSSRRHSLTYRLGGGGGSITSPRDAMAPSPPMDLAMASGLGAASEFGAPGVSAASFQSVVPNEFWSAWLAPGTPARTRVEAIAASLRASLGLGLFGFDILLVPNGLAHSYQRDRCPLGFGESLSTSSCPAAAAAAADTTVEEDEASFADSVTGAAEATPTTMDDEFWGPEAMFDLTTGEPTEMLTRAIPCVIDVNYFPGYKGWTEANENMLEMMAERVRAVDTA